MHALRRKEETLRDEIAALETRLQQGGKPLIVRLEHGNLRSITMKLPLEPSSWQLETSAGQTQSLASFADSGASSEPWYISVAQDADGQHRFVSFGDALEGRPLLLLPEELVKQQPGAKLLYARAEAAEAAPRRFSASFATRDPFKNYNIIPWISLGDDATRSTLVLSDEASLTREPSRDAILPHITLVVNCHEEGTAANPAKYTCGRASANGLEVVAHAVHTWYSARGGGTNKKNDAIQAAIWRHLQGGGSVAVHCLAGIHRAACITACHFLYRHYTLGHSDVPSKVEDIYRLLQSVRPAVSPAYVDILREYEKHVKSGAARPRQ